MSTKEKDIAKAIEEQYVSMGVLGSGMEGLCVLRTNNSECYFGLLWEPSNNYFGSEIVIVNYSIVDEQSDNNISICNGTLSLDKKSFKLKIIDSNDPFLSILNDTEMIFHLKK